MKALARFAEIAWRVVMLLFALVLFAGALSTMDGFMAIGAVLLVVMSVSEWE